MNLLRLPGSHTSLVPGKWFVRTRRKMYYSSSWNRNCGALLLANYPAVLLF